MIIKRIGSSSEYGGWQSGLGPGGNECLNADSREPMTKIASKVPMTDEMQDFWNSYPKKHLKQYLFVRINILGAGEYWGCFPAGSMVTTMSGPKPIENVCPGEHVLTHENRYRPVLAVQDRPHESGLIALDISGHSNLTPNIFSTPNHEFRVVRKEDLVHVRRDVVYKRDREVSLHEARTTMIEFLQPEWVAAEDIQRGDYIMEPFPVSEDSTLQDKWGSEAIAVLAGWYAAEGCIIRRYDYEKHKERPDDLAGVVFVVSGPEEASIIEDAANRVGRPVHVTHEETLSRVELRWTDFARFCASNIGSKALSKTLSESVMTMPVEWQKTFFSAYAQGDGYTTNDGSVRVTSASEDLLGDVRRMIARFGWLGSINGRHNEASNFYNGNPIFELHVGASNFSANGNKNSEGYLHPDGFILSRVREVAREEWAGTVFNLHVDEDNSYVVNGISVHNSNLNGDYFPEDALKKYHKTFHHARIYLNHDHDKVEKSVGKVIFSTYNDAQYAKRVEIIAAIDRNDPRARKIIEDIESGKGIKVSMGCKVPYDRCSVCGHIAPTQKEYCVHLKQDMNRILPDGTLVCAINDHPAFFDASAVIIEADPSSGYMEKVASLLIKAGSKKTSAMEKPDTSDEPEKKEEKPAEDDVIEPSDAYDLEEAGRYFMDRDPKLPEDTLMRLSDFPIEDIMGTLAGMHIPLKNKEYTFIIVKKHAGPEEARAFYRQGGSLASEKPCEEPAFDLFENYSPDIERIMLPFLEARSLFPGFAQKRIVIEAAPASEPGPIMKVASAGSLYAAYRRDAGSLDRNKVAAFIHTRPRLFNAVTRQAESYLVKTASVIAYGPSITAARIMLKGAYRV